MQDAKTLLLGNGFDLFHDLPTKYDCFLNTVQQLEKSRIDDIKTVGQVFSAMTCNNVNSCIARSYQKYKDGYDALTVDLSKIKELVCLAKGNVWFRYFSSTFNKDLGWIDFEKEIAMVISVLSKANSKLQPVFSVRVLLADAIDQHTFKQFAALFDSVFLPYCNGARRDGEIRKEYIMEIPYGSGNCVVDKEKITNKLYEELHALAKMLSIYLKCFVDNAVTEFMKRGIVRSYELFRGAQNVFTFNYTDTFERIYGNCMAICHIHGKVDGEIVLGVNADEEDEVDNLNTSFIAFKKYYQRILYGTDVGYQSMKREFEDYREDLGELCVIGHSLDVTDIEIIQELFSKAENISIMYYDKSDVGKYIRNLVSMYGKKEFDILRTEKHLRFVSLQECCNIASPSDFIRSKLSEPLPVIVLNN